MTRREFLTKGAAGFAGLTIVPGAVLGKAFGQTAPLDRLNIAGVGIGGRGAAVLREMESENIVALCDVDWKYSGNTFNRYPNAKRFWDYRKMLDEMGKSIDAVVCATADHTHALVCGDSMTLGKHVYCEKPLTHSVYESRLLTKLAEKYKVATQMGNQGASGEGLRQICDWIWAGEIGEVTRVDCWTNRPIWPQGLTRPREEMRVPDTMNWDLFIGPAQMRPYNPLYTPWNWRGWWDFGTGALGDMACHIIHPAFKALKLGYPTKVQGTSTLLLTECAPTAETAKFTFPARGRTGNINLPEVDVYWYDGGIMPPIPEGVPYEKGKVLSNDNGGVIFHGTKDSIICRVYAASPYLLSGRNPQVPANLRAVPGGEGGHQMDWVRACKESPANRVETASPFSEAGPFNEMVVMGVLGVRLQSLNKILEWDGPNMRFTNIGDNETMRIVIEDGFTIEDGHPSFDKTYTEPLNAKAFAAELIKHNYRNGWKLADMPV